MLIFHSLVKFTLGYKSAILINYYNGLYRKVPSDMLREIILFIGSPLNKKKGSQTTLSMVLKRAVDVMIKDGFLLSVDLNNSFSVIKKKKESSISERYNCVIDVDAQTSMAILHKVIENINNTDIKISVIQVRIFQVDNITTLLSIILESKFKLEILFPKSLSHLINDIPLTEAIKVFYFVDFAKDVNFDENDIYIELPFNYCPSSDFHSFDITLHRESLSQNVFFNNKISFDTQGNLKVYPTHIKQFGNVMDLQFSLKICLSKKFTCLSSINKLKILVCRDCEYKISCTDPRIPEKGQSHELYTYNSECPYNPYIAKWNTEGYQTVAESIADGVVSEEFVYRALES